MLITEAYVEGLQNYGNLEKTKKSFDPTFNLLIIGEDNTLHRYAISDWINNISQQKKQYPNGPKTKTSVTFIFIDITGNSAVAKIELREGNKHAYTDYLSLYRFKEGWRIVSKIYYQH